MRTAAKGFTLIELLVVIAIIGILAGIVLAALGNARTSGADAKRVSEIRQIQYALELYRNINGSYPCALYTGGSCAAGSTLQGGTGGMKNVPKDPSGTGYSYAGLGSGSTCSGYHLGAALSVNTNQILKTDKDAAVATVCTNSTANFTGLSATAGGTACNTTAGTAQPGGTETCYDVSL